MEDKQHIIYVLLYMVYKIYKNVNGLHKIYGKNNMVNYYGH